MVRGARSPMVSLRICVWGGGGMKRRILSYHVPLRYRHMVIAEDINTSDETLRSRHHEAYVIQLPCAQ